MTDQIDALASAQSELAAASVPTPDDILADVGPLAQLYYLERLAYTVLSNFTAMLTADGIDPVDDDSEPVRALAAIGEACGNLDGACILLSILPEDARQP